MSQGIHHTIYFVRHGQCEGNVTGEVLPPEKDNITKFGRAQSAALGQHLKDVQFTKAYASTYERAIETVKGILAESTKKSNVPLLTDNRIEERDMGDMVGLQAKEVAMKTLAELEAGKKFNEIEVPGGETQAQYVARIRSFFKELFDSLKEAKNPETILIVSHGLTMRRFLYGLRDTFSDICHVQNWSLPCGYVIDNTACTVFTVSHSLEEPKPVINIVKINDKEHYKLIKSSERDNNNAGSNHAITREQQMLLLEKLMKIPGAKEDISGCITV